MGDFMKQFYPEKEIIRIIMETTSMMVHKHYCENDPEFLTTQFDDDIIWLGAGENESASGLETVSNIFLEFKGKVPECEITEEEYSVQKIAQDAYVCTGIMWISTKPETGFSLRVHQRITTVFRWIDGNARCCHLHISNPYTEMTEEDIGFPTKMAQQSYEYLQEQIEVQKKELAIQTAILKKLSYEDILTGVNNRNKFVEVMERPCNGSVHQIGIAYFDLNGLKLANDLYGHSVGDELLCRAAAFLSQTFPKKVYRIGGDEFVVIDMELNELEFRKAVREVENKMKKDGISIVSGVSWRSSNYNIKEQLEEADKLMYQAKKIYYLGEEKHFHA